MPIISKQFDEITKFINTQNICRTDSFQNIKNKKISILISYNEHYKNNIIQILNNFQKIYASNYDFEVIIINTSNCNNNFILQDLIANPTFIIICVTRTQICNLFNYCNGDTIILQNHDFIHNADIINHIHKNLTVHDFFNYSDCILNDTNIRFDNPRCFAIFRSNLIKYINLNNIHNIPDDFISNVNNLNITIIPPFLCFMSSKIQELSHHDNQITLSNSSQCVSNKKCFKYPKILHLYWDGNPFSFLNYITILSFNKFHKNWNIIIYTPTNRSKHLSWKSNEQKIKYKGTCYFDKLKRIKNLIFKNICFDEIGFSDNVSEVFKSDYFRYYILHKYGGVWSDTDIIFTANIEEKMNFEQDCVIFKCKSFSDPKNKTDDNNFYYPVGFFISVPNNNFFKYLMDSSASTYNPKNYQSIGANMLLKLFPNDNSIHNNRNFSDSIQVCNHEYYLPWAWNELDELYLKEHNVLPTNNIGIHWFNGSSISKKYATNLDKKIKSNSFVQKSYMDKLVSEYLKFA